MPDRSRKRPHQLAKAVIAIATGERPDFTEEETKSAAALLGRMGGLKGGKARAEKLSAKRRSQIARLAATARWRKHDD